MNKKILVGLVMLTPLLAACAATGSADVITIDDIETTVADGTLQIEVDGVLPNACYELSEVTSELADNGDVTVTLKASEVNEVCTQALSNFEEMVEVDVSSLEPGIHYAEINGVSERFRVE